MARTVRTVDQTRDGRWWESNNVTAWYKSESKEARKATSRALRRQNRRFCRLDMDDMDNRPFPHHQRTSGWLTH